MPRTVALGAELAEVHALAVGLLELDLLQDLRQVVAQLLPVVTGRDEDVDVLRRPSVYLVAEEAARHRRPVACQQPHHALGQRLAGDGLQRVDVAEQVEGEARPLGVRDVAAAGLQLGGSAPHHLGVRERHLGRRVELDRPSLDEAPADDDLASPGIRRRAHVLPRQQVVQVVEDVPGETHGVDAMRRGDVQEVREGRVVVLRHGDVDVSRHRLPQRRAEDLGRARRQPVESPAQPGGRFESDHR